METNRQWLKDQCFLIRKEDNYVAPFYSNDSIDDPPLFAQVIERNPKVIVLCIGGGVQERLGLWLREQYRQLAKPRSHDRLYGCSHRLPQR